MNDYGLLRRQTHRRAPHAPGDYLEREVTRPLGPANHHPGGGELLQAQVRVRLDLLSEVTHVWYLRIGGVRTSRSKFLDQNRTTPRQPVMQ